MTVDKKTTNTYLILCKINDSKMKLAVLAQMVACLPLVQQVRGSIPGAPVYFGAC